MEEKVHEEVKNGQLSRREFLKDAGIIAGGVSIGSIAVLGACKGDTNTNNQTITTTKTVTKTVTSPLVTQMAEVEGSVSKISLTINGKTFETEVKPNWTLQDTLREKLGFLSLKDMCFGYGACGSCSLIMNGRPVLSCMLLAIECDGAVIETAEGICDAKHPLVDAYIKYHCMQCGYCTPGFLVTAKALLDRKPKPTEEDMREILGGNICRCGTYPAHIRAVQEVVGA